MCWICKYGGHRARDCPTNYGGDPRSLEPDCTTCGEFGHKARWCTAEGDRKLEIKRVNTLVPPTEMEKGIGNADNSNGGEKWVGSPRKDGHPSSTQPRRAPRQKLEPLEKSELLSPTPTSRLSRKRGEGREHTGRRKTQVYHLLREETDFTCNVLMGDKKVKAFVDAGASVSLVSSKVFRQL